MNLDIRTLIYPEPGLEEEASQQLQNTVYTQPAIFSIEYAMAMVWMDLGIKPVAVLGHSMGEFTAACIAGVFDLETGLNLIALRGSIMQELKPGSMLTVMLPPSEVESFLNERLSISVINTPSSCVVSGDDEAITALKKRLDEKEIYTRLLETSHAFHSHMMDPILDKYHEFASTMTYNQPLIPVLSTVMADWVSPDDLTNPDYWVANIRQPVRYADAIEKLFEKPEWIFLEVGPRNTLTTLARQHPEISPDQVLVQSLRHPKQLQDDNVFILETLGRLWSCGYPVDWKRIYNENPVYKIPIPTYAFQRVRCWIDPIMNGAEISTNHSALENKLTGEDNHHNAEKRDIKEQLTAIWEEFLGVENIKPDDNFFELGGNSLVAVQLFDELKRKLGIRLPLSTLFESPTIEEIAKLIEPVIVEKTEPKIIVEQKVQSRKKHSSVLVRIQPEGDERPFFCIHGHFGNVLFFYELAKQLGKIRPFYGVQSVGLSGEEEPLTTVEAMAERIIREMMEVQPKGPYSFGGYCYGTLVSIEIAKKLDKMGETYDPILMIDPQPPAYVNVLDKKVVKAFKNISFQQKKDNHESQLEKSSLLQSCNYLYEKTYHKLKFTLKRKSLNLYIQMKDSMNLTMPALFRNVELANRVAHDNYVAALGDDFKADIELLLSKRVTEKFSSDPVRDWTGITKGRMNVHLVEDDGVIMSGEMFRQPYVQGTANVIKSIWKSQLGNSDRIKNLPLHNGNQLDLEKILA
jgi:malonyl CoA-acyl carrier protein transacylase/thioesterase domain-containing protein/acyl carrier protein